MRKKKTIRENLLLEFQVNRRRNLENEKGKRRTQDTFRKNREITATSRKRRRRRKNQRRKSDTKHSHRKRLYTPRA